MKTKAAIPVLRSFSSAKMQEFYIDFLGFSVDWTHRQAGDLPVYAQISLGKCKLHISEHHGDAAPGARVFIRVRGLVEYREALLARKYSHARPDVEETDWSTLEMTVADPFGNRLTFSEDLD